MSPRDARLANWIGSALATGLGLILALLIYAAQEMTR